MWIKKFIILFFMLFYGCQQQTNLHLDDYHTVDLTHPFNHETLYWPTEHGFLLEPEIAGLTPKGYYYHSNKFQAPEHGGTHVDAPIHFSKDKRTLDQIPINELIGNAILIDVIEKVKQDKDYLISKEDFLAWEQKNGKIASHSIILLRTGYEKFWPNRLEYFGTDQTGQTAISQLHFPGLAPDAARWLVEKSPKAVGIDTASIDYGQSSHFRTHQILCEHNITIFENLTQLSKLPTKNFLVFALPMKIEGGSGAPLRIIALIPKQRN